MTTQMALFPTSEEQRRDDWAGLFERAEWVSPGHPYSPGRTLGWRCPDCRRVEPTTYLLAVTHGLDPHVPRTDDPDEPWCRWLHRQAERAAAGLPPSTLPGDPQETS